MKFPTWAPIELVDLFNERNGPKKNQIIWQVRQNDDELYPLEPGQIRPLNKDDSEALLTRLITDPRMEFAWKILSKRYDSENACPQFFFVACQYALAGWKYGSKLTFNEKKKLLEDISKKATELAMLVRTNGSDVDYSAARYLSDWENPDSVINPRSPDRLAFYSTPLMSDLLQRLSDIANSVAERPKAMVVGQPKGDNAATHYFIRYLSASLTILFDQPLHEVVAITAAAVFDLQDLDPDTVRAIVRTNRPVTFFDYWKG